MLGLSGLMGNSDDGAATAGAHEGDGGGGGGGGGSEVGGVGSITGGFSEDDKGRVEEGERNSGGNRWPRQETLALLKIRSDMDVVFRDSNLKSPLWEEVSRKLAELGYNRSAKKCKEKFENVYKYHKRTKESRSSKTEGKTYRFFDQLEALENHPSLLLSPPSKPPAVVAATPIMEVVTAGNTNSPIVSQFTATSTNPIGFSQNIATPVANPNATSHPPPLKVAEQPPATAVVSNSSSSSTSSDDEPGRRLKRKRKWKDFFKRLMKEVIEKQEELQKNFLETLEKRERDRMIREEAWRVQEMARMDREHDLLVQERSMAAAKDEAVISFLQKVTQQQKPNEVAPPPQHLQLQMHVQVQENPLPRPPPPPSQLRLTLPPPQFQLTPPQPPPQLDTPKTDNGGENFIPASSSRWPKTEVQALIRLRTSLNIKYQENGPKGPLWEDISVAMRRLGYNRSAKRCKEKWENINKYFKKVKESNKKRPEDAKTCPYFQQLDALYKEKNTNDGSFNSGFAVKPENNPMLPLMVQPEQQFPPPPPPPQQTESAMKDHDNIDQNHEEDDGDEDNEIDDGNDDDDEDDGGDYEIVPNKPSSVATAE